MALLTPVLILLILAFQGIANSLPMNQDDRNLHLRQNDSNTGRDHGIEFPKLRNQPSILGIEAVTLGPAGVEPRQDIQDGHRGCTGGSSPRLLSSSGSSPSRPLREQGETASVPPEHCVINTEQIDSLRRAIPPRRRKSFDVSPVATLWLKQHVGRNSPPLSPTRKHRLSKSSSTLLTGEPRGGDEHSAPPEDQL